jgi:hypothetical protein
MKAVLVIVTGVFIAVALMGNTNRSLLATVWAKRNNYRIAAFQVEDTSLSNGQKTTLLMTALRHFTDRRSGTRESAAVSARENR